MNTKLFIFIWVFSFVGIFSAQNPPPMADPSEVVEVAPEDDFPVYYEDDTVMYSEIDSKNEDAYEDEYTDADRNEFEPSDRKFSEAVPPKYTGSDFDYSEKEEIELPTISNFWFSFFNAFSNIIMYVLIGIGVIIILYFIYVMISGMTDGKGSRKLKIDKKKTKSITLEDENTEDIAENDYLKLAELAENDTQYNLAYRFLFLDILKILNHKKHILWQKNKTNMEYISEIKVPKIQTEYQALASQFNYIWYGKIPLNEAQFHLLKEEIYTLKKQL